MESIIPTSGLIAAKVAGTLRRALGFARAVGVQRLAERRALIIRQPSVEALRSKNVIEIDTEDTVTRDEMTVEALWAAGAEIGPPGGGYDLTGDRALLEHSTDGEQRHSMRR